MSVKVLCTCTDSCLSCWQYVLQELLLPAQPFPWMCSTCPQKPRALGTVGEVHRHLLSHLTRTLWARQALTIALGLRAHIGCTRKEAADHLANTAQPSPVALVYAPDPG